MPEILDPGGPSPFAPPGGGSPARPLPTVAEMTLLGIGRRAFPAAQELLAGSPTAPEQRMVLGWHDSSVSAETGSFAVVAVGGGLDVLIGQIVRVRYGHRTVFAYVLAAADVPVELSLTRRTFAGLSPLSPESIDALVAVSS